MPLHERVYRRIGGEAPALPKMPALVMAGYQGRYARRGKMFWLTRILAFAPALVVSFMLYLLSQGKMPGGLGGVTLAELMKPATVMPLVQQFLTVMFTAMGWPVMFMAAIIGAPLIAEDIRRHALELWFSRPISGGTYFAGKFLTLWPSLLFVQAGPLTVVFVVLWAFVPGTWDETYGLYLRMLIASAMYCGVFAIVTLGVSALARTTRRAVVLWLVIAFFTMLAGNILVEATNNEHLAIISFRFNVEFLAEAIMDLPGPERDLWPSIAVVLALVAGSAAVIARRVGQVARS